MSYDIEKTYTNFWGGISDDDFIGPENSVTDMEGIDVQTNERYIQCMSKFNASNDYTHAGSATWVKETAGGPFRGTGSITLNSSGSVLSLGITTVDGMESYGTGTTQINYFFGRTDGVRKTDYLGTTNIGSISTSGYPIANTEITSIGFHVSNILFAKDNLIYSYNTTTDTTTLVTTLTPGTRIKYIYSYSFDSVVVATTNGNDTFIYELEFVGSTYTIVSKTPIYSETLLSAVGNYYELYWVSTYGIHIYQARQDQFVKARTIASNAKLGYNRGLIIVDGTTSVQYFSRKKPGRNLALTRIVDSSFTPDLIDKTTLLDNITGGSRVVTNAGAYKREHTITLRPLDGGIYNVPKADLSYRFGYMFQKFAYTNTATPQEIEFYIQTDGMEMLEIGYISIGKVTDATNATGPDSIGNPKYGYMEITPNMVKDALQTAGYPSTFGYVRTKAVLRAGDEFTTPTGYYRKAPIIFDLTIKANFVKK